MLGTNLLQVTTHEIGHALGMAHSNVPGAVMSPFYDGYDDQFRLGTDDIQGIRALYGSSKNSDITIIIDTVFIFTRRDFSCRNFIYRVAPKIGTIVLYALTLPNINRFSQLFHCQNQEKIDNNTVT